MYKETMDVISKVVSAAGVGVILAGLVISSAYYLWLVFRGWKDSKKSEEGPAVDAFIWYRQNLGRSIILGLEVLIAGDIVRTVSVAPTFTALGTLGLLVVIRSFLSWSLSMEIEGCWPWRAPRAPGVYESRSKT